MSRPRAGILVLTTVPPVEHDQAFVPHQVAKAARPDDASSPSGCFGDAYPSPIEGLAQGRLCP